MWTEADQAELDVLIHELCTGFFPHREKCRSCSAGFPQCPHVAKAIEAVLEWREARMLLSRAEALRRDQDDLLLERAL